MKDRRETKRFANRDKACMIESNNGFVCVDPSLPILNAIGKKYTMMIIGVIGNSDGKRNFNEILNDIPFSSSTIIAKRLRELKELNIIARITGDGGVTYSLTDFGLRTRASLLPLLKLMEEGEFPKYELVH